MAPAAGRGGIACLAENGRLASNRKSDAAVLFRAHTVPSIMTALVIGLLAGIVGMAYFSWGRRQTRFAPMLAGVALCVAPYLVGNAIWLGLRSIALLVVPFLTDI